MRVAWQRQSWSWSGPRAPGRPRILARSRRSAFDRSAYNSWSSSGTTMSAHDAALTPSTPPARGRTFGQVVRVLLILLITAYLVSKIVTTAQKLSVPDLLQRVQPWMLAASLLLNDLALVICAFLWYRLLRM